MTFDEVQTLFHEFGHGLQHMLTTVERPLAAGIRNVEWDAVELPSQFMENWCYHRETLLGLARHVRDRRGAAGRAVPEAVRRAHVPRGLQHAAPALLRVARPGAAPHLDARRRRVALRSAAAHRRAHHRHPAAARGPLPVRLRRTSSRAATPPATTATSGPRSCRPTRSAPSRMPAWTTPRPSRAPAGASATPSSRSAAAATRWRSSVPSAVASPARRRCSASPAWHAQPEPALTRVSGPAVPAYTARVHPPACMAPVTVSRVRPGGRAPSTAAGRAATAGPASPRTPRGWRSARASRSPPGRRCCGRRPRPRASARR